MLLEDLKEIRNEGATMLFIIKKTEETTFEFSQHSATFV